MGDKVHKVVVINKYLPWESISSKVALKENGVSFLEICHHGVPTDHGNPWVFSRNVLMALFSLFNRFFNSIDLSVQKFSVFLLRKMITVMIDTLSYFAVHVVK